VSKGRLVDPLQLYLRLSYPIKVSEAELVDEVLEPENLVESLPELLGHEAEEDEVDRAVEQGHDVHHLSQLYKYK
jgi:hypothetical protein